MLSTTEMRRFKRLPFARIQRLSSHIEYGVPDLSKFFTVECRDISQGGVSFFLNTYPKFRYAVIELGSPSKAAYWAVSVLHAEQTDDGRYAVGCCFLRQLKLKRRHDIAGC